jgi:adenosine deaminase
VVTDYAAEAAAHGAVYLEGIFTPAEAVGRGASWDEVFTGFCDGAQQAREEHGVEVRLTPDIPRGYPLETAIASLAEHPLPGLVAAGVRCSVSTDDPAMFGTDLTADYAAALQLGVTAEACYAAGVQGALCDEPTRAALHRAGQGFDWGAAGLPGSA